MAKSSKAPAGKKAITTATREKLEQALEVLDKHGSAPLTGDELTAQLKTLGMTITKPKAGGYKVALAGIDKTSLGLDGAIRTWAQKARRAILRGEV